MVASALRMSSFRIALLITAAFTAGVSLLLGGIYLGTTRMLASELEAVIAAELEGLTDEYRRGGLDALESELQIRADSWGRTGAVYLLVDADFGKRAGNLDVWPFIGLPPQQRPEFRINARVRRNLVTHPVRSTIVTLPNGYHLLVGTDVQERRDYEQRLRAALFLGAAITVLLGAGIGYLIGLPLARRVSTMTATCARIMGGDLSGRLPVSSAGDEFDELARAVNRMLERIEHQTERLRATFDSAAHDLRAPLQRVRIRLEDHAASLDQDSSEGQTIEDCVRDLDNVERTLNTLLQIARAQAEQPDSGDERVDLAGVARDVAELFEPVARTRGMRLQATVPTSGSAVVRGSRQLLAQLVTNLVENATKYGRAGGRIDIVIEARAAEGRGASGHEAVTLAVADDGPGIAPEQRERSLRPFERIDPPQGTPGSGLGLSLVAAVARLHQAKLTLQDNAPGLRVVIEFPAAGRVDPSA
jgi:signal transduction histidine kinase